MRDPQTGQVKRLHPELHEARSQIVWPCFLQFGQVKDAEAWAAALENDTTTMPSANTHRRIVPHAHQIAAVCAILSRGFIAPGARKAPSHTTLLADEPGMGKTVIILLLIAILSYYESCPQLVTPIMLRNDETYKYEGNM